MPLSLRALERNSATVTFQVGDNPDDTLTVEYYTHKTTNDRIATMLDMQQIGSSATKEEAQGRLREIDQSLIDLIKDWDFYEDEKFTKKVPLTLERLAKIDNFVKVTILRAITGNARGPEA